MIHRKLLMLTAMSIACAGFVTLSSPSADHGQPSTGIAPNFVFGR